MDTSKVHAIKVAANMVVGALAAILDAPDTNIPPDLIANAKTQMGGLLDVYVQWDKLDELAEEEGKP